MVLHENWIPFMGTENSERALRGLDKIGGIPLRNCPEPTTALGDLGYPTVMLTFILIGFLGFVFTFLIASKYNSVRVFNKMIRTNEISNTLWIFFYLFVGIRSVFDAVRYGINVVYEESDTNAGLFFATLVSDAIVTLFLTLSLNHQLKFRSTSKAPPTRQASTKSMGKNRAPQDPQATADHYNRVRTSFLTLLSMESIYFILFVAHLVFLYLNITSTSGEKDTFYWLFIAAYVLQRVPVLILSVFIIFSSTASEGPTPASRTILLFATLCFCVLACPASIITEWLNASSCEGYCAAMCPFYIGSWVDLLQWLQGISLLFFLAFVRAEYKRNMEETIWTTVSQIQDTFDFRRF